MSIHKSKHPWNRHSLLELNDYIPTISKPPTLYRGLSPKKEIFFYLDQETKPFLLNPESFFSLSWQTLHALIILSQAVIIPLILTFPLEKEVLKTLILELCNSTVFLIDILIKLNTGFYLQGHLNTDRFSILSNYLKSYFLLDSYSAIPFSYFIISHPWYTFLLIPKLAKLIQIYSYLGTIKLFLKNLWWISCFYYFEIGLSVVISVHWLSCMWLYVCLYDVENMPDAWAAQDKNYEIGQFFVKCVYFVIMTITTLGYGDYFPTGINEIIAAFLILFIGVIIFSFNITSVINLVIKTRHKIIMFKESLMNFNVYMEEKSLPNFLRYRIRKHLECTSTDEIQAKLKESEILGLLSDPLREEIFQYTDSGRLVQNCRIFLKLYRDKVLRKLSKFFICKHFNRNDSVIQQGELSTTLYFVLGGNLEVIHKETRTVFCILKRENYFGEIGFFTKRPRTATIRCVDMVETLILERNSLDFILCKFPIAALATKDIELACREGDYTVLEVKCYLCHLRGHIAAFCPISRLSPNNLNIPQEWVNKKRNSKVIKSRAYCYPNAYRSHVPQKLVKMNNFPDFGEGELFKKLSSVRENKSVEESEEDEGEKIEVAMMNVLSSDSERENEVGFESEVVVTLNDVNMV